MEKTMSKHDKARMYEYTVKIHNPPGTFTGRLECEHPDDAANLCIHAAEIGSRVEVVTGSGVVFKYRVEGTKRMAKVFE